MNRSGVAASRRRPGCDLEHNHVPQVIDLRSRVLGLRPTYSPRMPALHELSASAQAQGIASRSFSAVELLEAHLARIERLNPALNAIVTFDLETARAVARAADEALARRALIGPLHGVPFTLKDCHSTSGLRTTVGFPPLSNHVPTEDGTVARRMKAAGGILIGKTNVPPLLGGPYTDNPIFGRTNNPWNLSRTPGGSSGGAAAAVAAGLVPIDIGSDALGSVRLPSHFCGLFGLKPSERRVSLHGHLCFGDVPGNPRVWRSICTVGPLARSLEDLELAFDILSGADGFDTELPPLPARRVPTPELRSLRVAFAPTLPGVPVARELRETVEALAGTLSGLGARVEEKLPALDYDDVFQSAWQLIQLVGGSPDAMEEEPTPPRIVEFTRLFDRRDHLIRTFDRFMEDWDVLLLPASISTAFRHAAPRAPIEVDGARVDYRHSAHHCLLFNLSGQPGVVLPSALSSDGLPIGVQLVGRRWEDERLLAAARAISEVTGPFRPPPETPPLS